MTVATANLWTLPGTILATVAISITIIGWIVTALLARSNNSKNLKKLEINRLIDDLYFKLDFIYDEMHGILSKTNTNTTASYYIFIASVRHVDFTCKRINVLDSKKIVDTGLIAELRQACTNDAKYAADKVGATLSEIQYINEKIKDKYLKVF